MNRGQLVGASSQLSAARQLDSAVSRRSAGGLGGIAGRVYYALLIGLIIVAPIWLALRDAVFAGNVVFNALYSIELPTLVLISALPLSLFAFGLGASLGPIRGDPFTLDLLGSAALDRRATYGLRLMHSGLLLVGLLVATTVLLWSLESAPISALLLALGAAVAASAAVLTFWLCGMVVKPVAARLTATIGCILFVIVMAVLRARNLFRPIVGDPVSVLAVSTLLVIIAAITIALLLPKVRGERVLEQAQRWSLITMFAGVGDLTAARTQMQTSTGIGRSHPIPKDLNYWTANVRAGLIGLVRAPWRIIWIMALEAFAIILFTSLPFASSVAVIGATAVSQYFAFALFGERIRFAVEQGISPSLLGGTPGRGILAQLIVPLVIHLLALGIGLLIATKVFGVSTSYFAPWALLMTPFHLLVAVYSSLKREPPAWLTTPIITPMGDPSAVYVSLWQLDFILLVAAAGIVVHSVITASSAAAVVALLFLAAWLIAGTRRRYHRI